MRPFCRVNNRPCAAIIQKWQCQSKHSIMFGIRSDILITHSNRTFFLRINISICKFIEFLFLDFENPRRTKSLQRPKQPSKKIRRNTCFRLNNTPRLNNNKDNMLNVLSFSAVVYAPFLLFLTILRCVCIIDITFGVRVCVRIASFHRLSVYVTRTRWCVYSMGRCSLVLRPQLSCGKNVRSHLNNINWQKCIHKCGE